MSNGITTCARSLLGRILALAMVTAVLLYVGLYLATDGGINVKVLNFLHSISTPAMQDRQKELLHAVTERFKKYDRVELLAGYGVAILVGYMGAGFLGGLICSFRYRFVRGSGVLERRTMWLGVRVWMLVWAMLAVVMGLVFGRSGWTAIWLPVWLWLALGLPALGAGCVWVWRREWISRRAGRRRVILPKVRWPAPLWAVVLGLAFLLVAVVGLMGGWYALVPLPLPVWMLAALLAGPMVIVPAWWYRPELARRRVFVPGLRRQVVFANIRRMEVEPLADGGAALVVTLQGGGAWTVGEGSGVWLQRLGGVLGRVVGLKRLDLVTWG